MHFLVTGSAGFIGSALVKKLLAEGHTVTSLDNLDGGLIHNVPVHDNHTFFFCPLQNISSLNYIFRNSTAIDGVFHCAAQARIQPSIANPHITIDSNTLGTLNIINAMERFNIKHMVYSSSSSIYGNKHEPPFHEDMSPDCLTPYSVSKYSGELLCNCYAKLKKLKIYSLRYFNVYGEKSPIHLGLYSPVVNLFIQQALTKQPLTIVGDGAQSRDFTYVSDVVEATYLSMQSLVETPNEHCYEVVNVGTGVSTSLKQLANWVIELVPGSTIKENLVRTGEATHVKANTTKAKNLLGWWAKCRLQDMLPQIKEHLKKCKQPGQQ